MTCQGCLHEDVCSNGNCRCKDYTPREEWLRLPCKVGSKIYTIIEDGDYAFIDEGYVATIANAKDGIWIYAVYNCGLTYHYHISADESYFFTKEEAEKSLKNKQNTKENEK